MKEYFRYFVGKAVTVIINAQVNFRFKEEQMMDYFSGILEVVDDKGIWIFHPVTKTRSFILHPYIVSLNEEQMLFEDNPEHAKIIEEYRKEKPITAPKRAVPADTFVNPAALAKIAKDAKQAFTEDKK